MKSFLKFLTEIDYGGAVDEYGEHLAELIESVKSTGKKGKLTLTLDFTPVGETGQIQIRDELKVVAPKPDRHVTLLYAHDNGVLDRRDPRQPSLPGISEVRRDTPEEGQSNVG